MSSLYIHIPFCKSKCLYCSFVSFQNKDSLIKPYLRCLEKETLLYKGARLETLYIGGGTPTYLSTSQIESLFEAIRKNFIILPGAEVTIEANPATFDFKKAKALKSLGINRVSLGVQSLDDRFLRWLGRPHTQLQAQEAFKILRRAGFTNINLDLIYSLPVQSISDIKKDVRKLISFGSEHISLYALAISRHSELYKRGVVPLNQDRQARYYKCVAGILKKNGFLHYEVSNFAKSGAECRHNVNYWRGGNYTGLGVGAHSHKNGHRFWNTSDLKSYVAMIRKMGCAKEAQERLSRRQRLIEAFLVGLRLCSGVDLQGLEAEFIARIPVKKQKLINELSEHGLLVKEDGKVRATLSGMVVLDEICSRLI